jgi:hypothetical protein
VQKINALVIRRYRRLFFLCLIFSCVGLSVNAIASSVISSITYATRLDAVAWVFEGSKFSCQINHNIDDFGTAMFERKAGVSTRFFLQSQSPRMKSGKANLISQPPPWLASEPAIIISAVEVQHGETQINVKR